MIQQIGLFGYPLGHSISPAVHQSALDHYAFPARYRAWSTSPERILFEVDKLRGEEYLGANITIPYKEHVCRFLDRVDSSVDAVGAVNTIVRCGKELVGYNTDTYGFERSLTEGARFVPDGKRVLVLGAGGAARAAVSVLVEARVKSITIANRTVARAEKLADEFSKSSCSKDFVSFDGSSLKAACVGVDLIVNATSIGLYQGPTAGCTPIRGEWIPSGALVYDMVYTPLETPLLLEARRVEVCRIGGLSMLLYQAAAAFKLWTGLEAPMEVMLESAKRALRGK